MATNISEEAYREGTDPVAHTVEQTEAPQEEPITAPTQDELQDLQTAVLLVVTKDENVLPVVSIDNLKMERIASPREVYRICMDAADQLSSVATLGEMANIITTVQRESQKFLAAELAKMLIKANAPQEESNE